MRELIAEAKAEVTEEIEEHKEEEEEEETEAHLVCKRKMVFIKFTKGFIYSGNMTTLAYVKNI